MSDISECKAIKSAFSRISFKTIRPITTLLIEHKQINQTNEVLITIS